MILIPVFCIGGGVLVWIIILVVLALILLTPLGVDLSYFEGVFALKVKVGLLRLTLLPRKKKEGKPEKPKKPKKPKPEKEEAEAGEKKPSRFPKLTLSDAVELLGLVFKMLGRFRRFLSIDRLTLHLVTGAPDPFNAVLLYGTLNAALGALSPGFHRAFRVKNEDVLLGSDPTPGASLAAEGQLAFTWRIWALLHSFNCLLFGALRWYLKKRREQKQAMKEQPQLTEQKG